jgi:DegV family protein with EDD domain
MPKLVLITDSTADLPPEVAAEEGILVARASYAFDEHTFHDGDQDAAAFYGRMTAEGRAPRPFGTPESAFKVLYEGAFAGGESPVCIVAPFDVNPSFTTAIAAQLSLDEADMKVVNAGVASAGLCSLLLALSAGVRRGWDRDQLLAAVETLGPQCDTLFVPAGVDWLEASGRLNLIEDRVGEVDDGVPVVRVGTRITGVALAASQEEGLREAVRRAGARAPEGKPVIVTIDHAAAPGLAEVAAGLAAKTWEVARTVITELSPTIGSQLGPGSVGIGVCPAGEE